MAGIDQAIQTDQQPIDVAARVLEGVVDTPAKAPAKRAAPKKEG